VDIEVNWGEVIVVGVSAFVLIAAVACVLCPPAALLLSEATAAVAIVMLAAYVLTEILEQIDGQPDSIGA
jgi:hypothetical protein